MVIKLAHQRGGHPLMTMFRLHDDPNLTDVPPSSGPPPMEHAIRDYPAAHQSEQR